MNPIRPRPNGWKGGRPVWANLSPTNDLRIRLNQATGVQDEVSATSGKINPASEAGAPRPDACDVVFPSSGSPESSLHSQHRLRPDVTSDLNHTPPPPHMSCSSPPPYLTS